MKIFSGYSQLVFMTRLADGGDPMFKVKKSLVYTALMQNTFRQRTGVATRESSRCRFPGMPVNTSGERPLILAGHNSLSSGDSMFSDLIYRFFMSSDKSIV